MKTIVQFAASLLVFSAGWSTDTLASPSKDDLLVNAYGEPAGFGARAETVVPDTPMMARSNSRSDTPGMYVLPGYVDPRNFESLGDWQSRIDAESRATVTIGPLEVLGSGPTGPLTPEAMAAARAEVTEQVLDRIKATDHVMSSLKKRAGELDDATRDQFKSAAGDVAERRQALRESLRIVRAADGDRWTDARAAVSTNFNLYVQAMHRAEGVVSTGRTT